MQKIIHNRIKFDTVNNGHLTITTFIHLSLEEFKQHYISDALWSLMALKYLDQHSYYVH